MDNYEPLPPRHSSFKKSVYRHVHSREKFLCKVILPAIRGRSCPICLRNLDDEHGVAVITNCLHAYCLNCIRRWSKLKRKCPLCTAEFDSWFCNINPRFRTFRKEKLPPPRADEVKSAALARPSNSNSLDHRRAFRRSRDEMNESIGRRRQLPLRRTFGRPGSVPPDVIAERKLQWRASIYSRRLRAVPHHCVGNSQEQDISRNNGWKEQILQRIEPWIHRELQAVMGDPDPSVIVHVVTSIFIKSLEEKLNDRSRHHLTAPLEPFLHESLDVFWHELRCYAESSLTMETYDSVTEYTRME